MALQFNITNMVFVIYKFKKNPIKITVIDFMKIYYNRSHH